MVDSLDWGNIKERSEISYGRYVVDLGGCKLFTIRNGTVDFPATDYGVMVLHGLSAIGYLNFNPIDYAVIFDDSRPLVSNDGHRFRAIIEVQIQIADNRPTTWGRAVEQRNGLEARTRTVIETAARELFKEHAFKDIRIIAPAVLATLKDRVAEILPKETPYNIASLGYSVEAVDDAVEAGFIAAIRADTLAKEDVVHQKLAQETAEREHLARLNEQAKKQTRDADQKQFDRSIRAAEAAAEAELKNAAFDSEQKRRQTDIDMGKLQAEAATIAYRDQSDAEAEAMAKKLAAAGGDPLALLVLMSPELAAKVLSTKMQQEGQNERAALTADKNLADAHGKFVGLATAITGRIPNIGVTLEMPKNATPSSEKNPEDSDDS